MMIDKSGEQSVLAWKAVRDKSLGEPIKTASVALRSFRKPSPRFAEYSLVRAIREIREGDARVPAGAVGTVVHGLFRNSLTANSE
jgi:hypothetical protein